jgi:hypothetical protein
MVCYSHQQNINGIIGMSVYKAMVATPQIEVGAFL